MYFGIKENHIQLKESKFILVFINVAHATSPSVNRLCNCSSVQMIMLIEINCEKFWFLINFQWEKLVKIQYLLHLRF
jgi:hypothetical protein